MAPAFWVTLAAAGIYPDHLSYFNEAACLPSHPDRIGLDGGSRCGTAWLADSNVDWGQELPQLKSWLDQQPANRNVKIQHFGSVPPELYGIRTESAAPYLIPLPPRGVYVVSAHFAALESARPGMEWLRDDVTSIIGHAYYVYEIEF